MNYAWAFNQQEERDGGEKLIQILSVQECVRTSWNFGKLSKEKQHESKVNYSKIFLVEYVSTVFAIKQKKKKKLIEQGQKTSKSVFP